MKFSVIIPFYHAHATIARCLDSFLAQSVAEDMEILCIGDKAYDPTHAIVEEYVRKHAGIVHMHLRKGREPGSARNCGIQLAKGEYIMFADADDYVEPTILAHCVEALREHNADFACVGFERVAASGQRYSYEQTVLEVTPVDITPANVCRLAFNSPAVWGKLFRRDFIGDSRFPENDPPGHEDAIFFLSLAPRIQRYVLLPAVLYHYVVYEKTLVSTPSLERTQIFRNDLNAVRRKFMTGGLPPAYLDMLDIAAFIHVGIADAHRMARSPDIPLRAFCAEAKTFLQEHFPGWRRIPLRPYGRFTMRCTAVWLVKHLYKLGLAWLFIRLYNFMIKTLHKDVKW